MCSSAEQSATVALFSSNQTKLAAPAQAVSLLAQRYLAQAADLHDTAWAMPEEITATMLYLCSDTASTLMGQRLLLAG